MTEEYIKKEKKEKEEKKELKIENLILGGGGHKIVIHIGVIKALEEYDQIKNIKKLIGSSAGAFAILFIVLGYSYKEIEKITFALSPKLIHNINTNTVLNFSNTYGIDNSLKLNQIIKNIIYNKGFNPYISLKELYDATHIDFICSTTNLCESSNYLINYKNEPDMPVWLVVRASMGLPFLFSPIKYKNLLLIDGSVTNDIPIEVLTEEERAKLICIKILMMKKKKIEHISCIENIFEYILMIYKCISNEEDKTEKEIINILFSDISMLSNELSDDIKIKMIDTGYNAVKNYIINTYKSLTNALSPANVLAPE